jgi:ubiquinone/menaquinone biosynthesis C-methylase UbiE
MWDEMGQLQYNWLVNNGLRPKHTFLDIGCGSLRGGLHFIKYLESGNYYGIDLNQSLIEAGKVELQKQNINKTANLLVNEDFNFNLFKQSFDFALAQSVFTHLPTNHILKCLINVDKVLKRGGKFYATFFEAEDKHSLSEMKQCDQVTSYMDKDPFHYHYSVFEYLVDGLELQVEYIGDWKQPRNQKMLSFYKTKT